MTLSPEQIALRRLGVTATDVPAIAGVHPFKTAFGVWLDKTGRHMDDYEGSERAEWGHLLEPLLRAKFSSTFGVQVRGPVPTVMRSMPDIKMLATPDGIIDEWGTGWEGKTHSVGVRHEYGDEGTDEVPLREVLQCQTGMLVTGLRAWRLTAFIDGLPTHYSISADDELQGNIQEMSAKWWRDHVVADVPPPISADDDGMIKSLFPRDRGLIRAATEEERAVALDLRRRLREMREMSQEVDRLKNVLRAAIGDDAGLQLSEDAKECITWKRARDGAKTDWQAAAYDFATRVQLLASVSPLPVADLIEEIRTGIDVNAHTTTTTGSRRFLVPRHWGTP
jgi:predicted phage-related endonuclease